MSTSKNSKVSNDKKARVVRAIMDVYMETGEPTDAATIATRCGMSAAQVVNCIVDSQKFVAEGVEMTEVSRPSYSKNYPMISTGSHRVRVFAPTREAVRQEAIRVKAVTRREA